MINYYIEFGLNQSSSCEELCAQLFKEKKKWITRQNANSIEKRQEAERKVLLIEEASKIFSDKLAKEKYDFNLMREEKRTGGSQGAQATQPAPQPQPGTRSQHSGMTVEEAVDIAQKNYDSGYSSKNIDFCQRVIASGLEAAALYNYLGLAYWEVDDLQNAASTFAAAIEKYPDVATLYSNLGSLYLTSTTQYGTARIYIDRALELDPGDSFAQYLDIYYMFLTGEVDAAEEKIQAHILQNPFDTEFKERAANAYLNYSDKFLIQADNGDAYFPSQEAYDSVLYYRKKANEILSNQRTKEIVERTEKAGKRTIEKETRIVLIGLGVLGLLSLPVGILWWIGAVVLGYFAYIPAWKAYAMDLSGKRNIANTIAHVLYKVASVIIRIYYWIFRFLLSLLLGI